MHRKTATVLFLASSLVPLTAHAIDNYWIGTAPGDYNNAVRWQVPAIPTANDWLTIQSGWSDDPAVVNLNSTGRFLGMSLGDFSIFNTNAFTLGTGYYLYVDDYAELRVQTGGVVKTHELNLAGDYGDYGAGSLKLAGGRVEVSERLTTGEYGDISGHGQINIDGAAAQLYASGMISANGGALSFFANNGGKLQLRGSIEATDANSSITFIGDTGSQVDSQIKIGSNAQVVFENWTQAADATLTIGGNSARLTAGGSTFKGTVYGSTGGILGGTGEIAGSATFTSTSTILVGFNNTLRMNGATTYGGGTVSGLGKLIQTGPMFVPGMQTIAVDTFDWDGANENGTTTIQPNGNLTITSSHLDTSSGAPNFDGTIVIQGGDLTVLSGLNWQLDGTMRFDGPSLGYVDGVSMLSAGSIHADSGSARFRSSVDLLPAAHVIVDANRSVDFAGGVTIYRGPSVSGPGTILQSGDSTVTANTTVNVGTFNWDGFNAFPTMTINPGVVFTINAAQIESNDATADGYDGTVTVNDGILVVNTATPWRLDGTMNLNDQPAATFAALAGSTMRLFGTVNATGSPIVNANVEFNGGTVNTSGGNVVFANPVSTTAAAMLHKTGNGTMTISNSQSYAPGSTMQIHAGTLVCGTDAGGGGANLSLQVAGRVKLNTSQHLANLALDDGGMVMMGAGPHVLWTRGISVAGAPGAWLGAVDLAESDMAIDYAGVSPLPTVTSLLRSGFAAGAWIGNGVRSSSAANTPGQAIGVAEAGALGMTTFAGEPVDDSTVILRHTLSGDANLDLSVNIADFALLASNFNTTAAWTDGDFNYDGSAGIGDFSLLASNFNTALAVSLPRGSAVPEPALSVAGLSVIFARVRRNRKQKD